MSCTLKANKFCLLDMLLKKKNNKQKQNKKKQLKKKKENQLEAFEDITSELKRTS